MARSQAASSRSQAAQTGSAPVEKIGAAENPGLSEFVSEELTKSDRPELTSAKIIISGGRALGSAEKFKEVILPVADKLAKVHNAKVGDFIYRPGHVMLYLGQSQGRDALSKTEAIYLTRDKRGPSLEDLAPEIFAALTRHGAICRQKLREFAGNDLPVHLCGPDGLHRTVTLGQLLPMSFGPQHFAQP